MAYLDEMPEPAELTWTDLHYRVKAGTPPRTKTVLHTSSGTFKPGDSVALMGPSGAGTAVFNNLAPNITVFYISVVVFLLPMGIPCLILSILK